MASTDFPPPSRAAAGWGNVSRPGSASSFLPHRLCPSEQQRPASFPSSSEFSLPAAYLLRQPCPRLGTQSVENTWNEPHPKMELRNATSIPRSRIPEWLGLAGQDFSVSVPTHPQFYLPGLLFPFPHPGQVCYDEAQTPSLCSRLRRRSPSVRCGSDAVSLVKAPGKYSKQI